MTTGTMEGHRRWTQIDITELRRLVATGGPMVDLAAGLDRSVVDVDAMLARLRIAVAAVQSAQPIDPGVFS